MKEKWWRAIGFQYRRQCIKRKKGFRLPIDMCGNQQTHWWWVRNLIFAGWIYVIGVISIFFRNGSVNIRTDDGSLNFGLYKADINGKKKKACKSLFEGKRTWWWNHLHKRQTSYFSLFKLCYLFSTFESVM